MGTVVATFAWLLDGGRVVATAGVVVETATRVVAGAVSNAAVPAKASDDRPEVAREASVDRTELPAPRPAWVGTIVHNTASASRPPTAPVAAVRPRPMASGGSEWSHCCWPNSLG